MATLELGEGQEKLNQEEELTYEQMIEEQKEKFSNHLRFSVDSALSYQCTESTADDWIDTHETTAKLIIELQRHAKAVAEHLKIVNKAELTAHLREYAEKRFDVSAVRYQTHVCCEIGK